MPATAVSSSYAWAAYLAASVALSLSVAPALSAVIADTRTAAAYRCLDGVSETLLELEPGMEVNLVPCPGVEGVIGLEGHQVTVSWANATLTRTVPWDLPSEDLLPGVEYHAELQGTRLVLT